LDLKLGVVMLMQCQNTLISSWILLLWCGIYSRYFITIIYVYR